MKKEEFKIEDYLSLLTGQDAENLKWAIGVMRGELGEDQYEEEILNIIRKCYFLAGAEPLRYKSMFWASVVSITGEFPECRNYQSKKHRAGCYMAGIILINAKNTGLVREELNLDDLAVYYTVYKFIEDCDDPEPFANEILAKYDEFRYDIPAQRDLLDLIHRNLPPTQYPMFEFELRNPRKFISDSLFTPEEQGCRNQARNSIWEIVDEIEPFYDEDVFPSFGTRDEYYEVDEEVDPDDFIPVETPAESDLRDGHHFEDYSYEEFDDDDDDANSEFD